MQKYQLRTRNRVEFQDITASVADAIRSQQVDSGLCVVYCPHTTAAITINENADPDVPRDINAFMNSTIPHRGDYRHAEGNSDSHIKAAYVGPSQTLIIHAGRPLLGRWQGVFFCEFDGPRDRTFYVKVMKDPHE
ncbi:MAG: secondary thiamine-phosphate synthase enzyme YjbQ [Candidatus Sumerlaeaceae bacterium]|nr:secondary thiamine-phosphate synthase enzyme YjbQ [Candidatus Sumerlaeaceae bacterium]